MLSRCNNRKDISYKYYGARGIKICKKWLKFENFINDIGEPNDNLTIERIDSNDGYKPSNCKWATMKEQQNNRTNNRKITFSNLTKTISQWSDFTGINSRTILSRLKRGWNIKNTLTKETTHEAAQT